MSFPFTNNRFLPVNIKGDDNITSDLNGNVSLLCNGKTSLYGDTTISAGKVLAIGKSPSSSTYPLDVSGNIQYSGNLYKSGVIQDGQNSTIIYELPATASVVCNKDYVYQGLNNTTILTVKLPDESTISIGYRFVVYPMKNWFDIRPTGGITINCVSGSQITNFSTSTANISMTTNNTWYEFICVATTGTVRWVVINSDPRTLLVRNNTFSGINNFTSPIYVKGYYPTEALQSLITATGTLISYSGTGLYYSVNTVEAAADTTITLPTITGTNSGNVGNRITFIRSVANSTFNVSFIGSSSQFVYNINNVGGITAQNLMPSGSLRCSFVSARDTASTFGWFQIDTDFCDLRSAQNISGLKTFLTNPTFTLAQLVRVGALSDGNTAVGNLAQQAITTALNNFNFGSRSGMSLTTGGYNHCFGNETLQTATTAIENMCIGYGSLAFASGSYNTAIGSFSMTNSGDSNHCISFGKDSAYNIRGDFNVNIGNYTSSTAGVGNTNNVVIGYNAKTYTNQAQNVLIGSQCTNGTTAGNNNNVIIGYGCSNSGAFTNSVCIGFGSTINASNRINLGSSSQQTFCNGGLTLPAGQVLNLLGSIVANSLTVTPTEVSLLSGRTGGLVDTTSNQTIGGLKVFSSLTEQAVNSTIRSNWATGGTLGKLNRNISEILTPLDYDLSTKVFGIYDEVNGAYFEIDLSGSQLTSSADLNNFYYDVLIGRDLTVSGDINVGRDLKLSNQTLGGVVRNVIIDPSANRILQVTQGDEVSLGRNALLNSTGSQNIGIGNLAGSTNTTGIRNIFISPTAPVGTVQTGTNCTYVGYNTGNSGVGNWVNSTALGTGALITASNQISLGVAGSTTIARGALQATNNFSLLSGSFGTPFYIPLEANPSVITGTALNLVSVNNLNEYTIEPTGAFLVTLPSITLNANHRVGLKINFVRGPLNNTSTISFVCGNTAQLVYDINNVNIGGGTVSQALMPQGINRISIQSARATATTFAWYVISQNDVDFSSAQTITGAKTFTTGGLTISPSTNLNLNGTFVSNFLNISPTEIKLLEVAGQVNIKDNTTGNSLIRFNNSSGTNLSTAVGLNALSVETQSAGRNNCSFGANSMLLNSIGRYNCAFGVNALRNQTGTTFSYNSAYGWSSLENVTVGTYTTAYGARTGTQVTTAEGCTFLGAVSDFNSTTQYNFSTAVGFGVIIEQSNEVRLGRITETVVCPNRIQVRNSYIATSSSTIITGPITLSNVLFRYYSVTSSGSTYQITLPTASVTYLDCTITFRRVSGTITDIITTNVNIYPLNSITTSTILLDTSNCQTTIVCMVTSASPTYGWVAI